MNKQDGNLSQGELDEGLQLYLKAPGAYFPRPSPDEVRKRFGDRADAILAAVEPLVRWCEDFPVDWAQENLGDAAQRLRQSLLTQYPQMGPQAIDVLLWRFSVLWR